MEIVTTQVRHAQQLSEYYLRNNERFAPWHPLIRDDHHSPDAWTRRLQDRERDYMEGRAVHFIGMEHDRVIGACSLTGILYSPACFCQMGYSVDAEYEGQGNMTRLARHTLDYAFGVLRLNRINANYMPANSRSARLLKKLGFEQEGVARRYLCINGRWEDHVLTSLINPGGEVLDRFVHNS